MRGRMTRVEVFGQLLRGHVRVLRREVHQRELLSRCP